MPAKRPASPSSAAKARVRITTPASALAQGADGDTGAGRHHLLQLGGMDPAQMRALLTLAKGYNQRIRAAGGPLDAASEASTDAALDAESSELAGKVVANLFFEDSTRTRLSFTVAARRLGATVIDLTSVGSSVNKGETVADTAANIAAMGVDAIVVRHKSSGAAALVARTVGQGVGGLAPCSVINAGDGRHEHPTQGLLDIFTLADVFDRLDGFDLSGLTVAIVGDIASSRVARSDIAGMTALGARVICIGPPSLAPKSLATLGCEVSHDLDSIIDELDAINVLRIQFERHEVAAASKAENAPLAKSSNVIASVREYAELFGINARRASRMKRSAIIMHPGPVNRGVEMTAEVADSQRSMVLRQVTHGVAVRMAVLRECLRQR